jgi:hypothetical protein
MDQLGRMVVLGLVVHQVHLEKRVKSVLPVRLVSMVHQVCKDHLVLQALLVRMGRQVHRVLLESQGQQVLMESLAVPVSLANKVTMGQLDHPDLQERKGHLETWAAQELPEHLDRLAQMVRKANLVHQGRVECQVQMEKQERQDRLVLLAQMARQVLMVLMAHQDAQEFQDHPVSLGRQVLQVRGAHHRNQDLLVCRGCKVLQDHHLTQKKWIWPLKPQRVTLEKYSISPR